MPLLLLTGCVSVSQVAICDGTKESRSELANSILDGATNSVILSGTKLIAQIDQACGDQ